MATLYPRSPVVKLPARARVSPCLSVNGLSRRSTTTPSQDELHSTSLNNTHTRLTFPEVLSGVTTVLSIPPRLLMGKAARSITGTSRRSLLLAGSSYQTERSTHLTVKLARRNRVGLFPVILQMYRCGLISFGLFCLSHATSLCVVQRDAIVKELWRSHSWLVQSISAHEAITTSVANPTDVESRYDFIMVNLSTLLIVQVTSSDAEAPSASISRT
jgi:hypothetical protein